MLDFTKIQRSNLTWLDLVPWQCSWKGTQRQLCYRLSPDVSILSKMNGVVYSQAHVSTVTPDYIEPSLLWSSTSFPTLHITFQCQLCITILAHSVHIAKVSKSSLPNPIVDILAQLQPIENLFVSNAVPSCQLLFITNRKSHTGFRLVLSSMSLNDLERRNRPCFALFTEFDWFAGQIRHSG